MNKIDSGLFALQDAGIKLAGVAAGAATSSAEVVGAQLHVVEQVKDALVVAGAGIVGTAETAITTARQPG